MEYSTILHSYSIITIFFNTIISCCEYKLNTLVRSIYLLKRFCHTFFI